MTQLEAPQTIHHSINSAYFNLDAGGSLRIRYFDNDEAGERHDVRLDACTTHALMVFFQMPGVRAAVRREELLRQHNLSRSHLTPLDR